MCIPTKASLNDAFFVLGLVIWFSYFALGASLAFRFAKIFEILKLKS
jgi:hypothetical protein